MSAHYPRKLQRLATELAMHVTYMRGYLGHYGSISKDHPLVKNLDKANEVFQTALVEWEDHNQTKKAV